MKLLIVVLVLAGMLVACPARIPISGQEFLNVIYPMSDPCLSVTVDFIGKLNGIGYTAQGLRGYTGTDQGSFDVRLGYIQPQITSEDQAALEIGTIKVTCSKAGGVSTSTTLQYNYGYQKSLDLYSKDFN